MGKFTDKVRSMFGRSRPIPREDADEIDDWVNEGGAPNPEGPPRVIDIDNGSGIGNGKKK
ncbi:hypothetical protein [Salinibacterium sp. PAMC 21357]|uniref:hypothetical protein n=1 Tax=Salinibacterium sp. PAMC 21357 TaxID=1112215 RepID=UPI0004753079|nr:hypothetical protein [Salinibacterium sp. PAMC 21357]